jgi:hypothetical protein
MSLECKLLQECGRLDREKAFLLGASGGAFAVASYVSGVEPERMHEIVKEVAWTVNKNGILGKVRGPLMEAFQVRCRNINCNINRSPSNIQVLKHT